MAKITIYSTATCGFCKMLKSYLQSKNIPYEEKHADQAEKNQESEFAVSTLEIVLVVTRHEECIESRHHEEHLEEKGHAVLNE